MLAGNGVLTAGVDLEMAYLRMELVEHVCRVALVARQAGGINPLPVHMLPPLLNARKRAGLGPEARGLAPTPHTPAPTRQPDLEQVVREEIQRVLRSK